MPISLGSTDDRNMPRVACNYRLWLTHSSPLGSIHRSDNIGLGVPASSLESIHGSILSGMAYYHRPWTTQTNGLRRVWQRYNGLWAAHIVSRHRSLNVIVALRQQTRSDYSGCGMLSLPLEIIHDRMTMCVAFYHFPRTPNTIG